MKGLRFSLQLLALVIPLVLANCTDKLGQNNMVLTGQSGSGEASMSAPQPAERTATSETDVSAALASVEGKSADYRISPYDTVQVTVFQVQDLNKAVDVAADGTITLPLLGKVAVAGYTTQNAERIIADRLRKKYLQSPQVSVTISKYGQRATISGAVSSPKVILVDSQLTLSEAVAQAGGLNTVANASRVHIARRDGQRVNDTVYNLDSIQAGTNSDPSIKGGDIVVAEQSGVKVALNSVKDLLPFAVLAAIF
jgi:polysaccharide export outer membrane protein